MDGRPTLSSDPRPLAILFASRRPGAPDIEEQIVDRLPGELDFVAGACHDGARCGDSPRKVIADRIKARTVAPGYDDLRELSRRELR
jgi:hypothetical protein